MDVLWLGHADCHDINKAGAKAAHLSRLASCYRIPPGFCITAEEYSRWTELIDNGRPGSTSPAIPPDLSNALTSAYRDLADTCGVADPSVAVRSSAVDEDGAAYSFAGQHETYLNIVGAHAVTEAVVRCWTSVRTARALAYRQRQGLAVAGTRLAVLVQQLVPADVSAVVFSANPVTGRDDEVMINASWGLGESLVSGTVTPDTYIVRKPNLAIGFRDIAEKRRMTVLAQQGTREVPVPCRYQKSPTIDDSQVAQLARLSMTLEAAMGWPVDIECAYRGRDLYLLQCRPITTLSAF
jgi:phosphoenolpyruvate synthase/pyruvate phosphate dikinase